MEKSSGKKRQVAAPAAQHSPADAMMAIAMADIEITGIEYRNVVTSIGGGLGGSFTESKPFLVGRVAVGGIPAKLAMRVDFGAGGFIVLEGED